MTNVFKKTILSVVALGCVSNMSAETDKRKSTASSGQVQRASLGMVIGAAGATVGLGAFFAGANATELSKNVPSSVSETMLSMAPYAFIAIPSIILAGYCALYCATSAKGIFQKTRSLTGSTITLIGGALLTAGCLAYALSSKHNSNIHTLSWAGVKDVAFYGNGTASTKDLEMYIGGSAALAIGGGLMSVLGHALQPADNKNKDA